jgi:hypothetical protein
VTFDRTVRELGTKLIQGCIPCRILLNEDQAMKWRLDLDCEPCRAGHNYDLRFGVVLIEKGKHRENVAALARARECINIDQRKLLVFQRAGKRPQICPQARELVVRMGAAESVFAGG